MGELNLDSFQAVVGCISKDESIIMTCKRGRETSDGSCEKEGSDAVRLSDYRESEVGWSNQDKVDLIELLVS
jgi:hypothetical protein